jgi:membrane fusion protein (multidrug efflux system)
MYVDVSQSSAEMLRLQRAMQSGALSKGGVSVRLRLEDGSIYETSGVLQFADVTVDQNTGAVTLRATFPNPNNILLPGMYVTAIVTEGVRPNSILAPQVGVSRDERGLPVALVVGPGDKAEQRTLTTGQAIGDKWLVTDGLKVGDKLITEGLQNAKPGQPVRPVPAGSPPPRRPPGGPAQSGK